MSQYSPVRQRVEIVGAPEPLSAEDSIEAMATRRPVITSRARPRPADTMPGDGRWSPPQEFDEYSLVRLLGQGSMGRVYLARDAVLDRPVAVKFIGHVAPDADDRERFIVEARAVARLQHPNVVTIYRVGELDGHPYLITEYVAGKSLSELSLPLPWRRVLELAIGLSRGLAAAHRHGVLHRDIKLANAMLAESGEVKLLDFSLAKLIDPLTGDPIEASTSARVIGSVGAVSAEESGRARAMESSWPMGLDNDRTQAALSSSGLSAATLSAVNLMRHVSLTQTGMLLGTPNYMAPELWRSEPASRRSDVYALGMVMYILAAGRPPNDTDSSVELAMRVQEFESRPLLDLAADCDPQLANVIDRCLRRDPFERWASADELLAALEALDPTHRSLEIPLGNPYRGLEAFESRHRALFFGRGAEVRAVLERLRSGALVVVAGDSGVGKSSLCKAGVVPLVEEGNLDPSRQWVSATMTPGRYPLATLIATLAGLFELPEDALHGLLAAGPSELLRALRRQLGDTRGRLLMIDQLEELTTLGAAAELAVVGPLLARLASGMPGLRVLATVRGDFLTRVAQLPGIGDELSQAIYFLRPLAPEGAREAIVGPARAKGVTFASAALVDELVTAGARGSLPLLQFALAELWEIRDQQANSISSAELAKIGGVSGALARHGDAALAELIPEQRAAARRVLMRLVTVDDTRAVRCEEELAAGSPAAEAALKALVRARLVVAREVGDLAVFEIAHEALIAGWATLGGWLEEERETRAVLHRLELAVAEWERLGRGRDALWSGAPLQELQAIDPAQLRPRELAFVAACRGAAARSRAIRRVAAVAVPLGVLLTAGAMWLKGQVDLGRRVDAHVAAAAEQAAALAPAEAQAERERAAAFAAFERGATAEGEALWARQSAALPELERGLARSAQQLEAALGLDAGREDVREQLLATLLRRALRVEVGGRGAQAVEDQLERLRFHDHTGEYLARWEAPARLEVTSEPAGARVLLERYVDERGHRRIDHAEELGYTPLPPRSLPRGSYRLRLERAGRAPVLYPVALARGESVAVTVELPAAADVPDGLVFVPAGRFAYGSDAPDDLRGHLAAEPLHTSATGAFLIARNELTYGEYLTFLAAQPPARRLALTASDGTERLEESVRLTELPRGRWRIEIHQGSRTYAAESGELLRYEGRTQRASVEWERLPVTGITVEHAKQLLAWLDESGRVRGARFCGEQEWERAARGADDRDLPVGDRIDPDEANIDVTHGKIASAFGPDPVGSYAQSQSPFGLHDVAGNVFEMTASARAPGEMVARGGAFFYAAFAARVDNRTVMPTGWRHSALGLRVCATWPPPRG